MGDDVDRLLGDWGRARTDLDLGPMAVFSRVSRLSRLVDRARAEAFATYDLGGWEFDVLAALRRAGKPYELSPGRLTKETMVTSGTMTNRVDRLVTRELVTRFRDPHDRRGVLVRLTGAGLTAVDGAMEDLLAREAELLGALDGGQRGELAALLRLLLISFERQ